MGLPLAAIVAGILAGAAIVGYGAWLFLQVRRLRAAFDRDPGAAPASAARAAGGPRIPRLPFLVNLHLQSLLAVAAVGTILALQAAFELEIPGEMWLAIGVVVNALTNSQGAITSMYSAMFQAMFGVQDGEGRDGVA